MSKSEHMIMNNNENLIISFGGLALVFGGILPFEFLNYLSSIYKNNCDLVFFIDKEQCWYHKGIKGITKGICGTMLYLNNIIKNGNYKKVIFMGTSAGGYASILFGSLCNNVSHVISFIPQTKIQNAVNKKYSNLKNIINKKTKYNLYGNTSFENVNGHHHISQCENIEYFPNVTVHKNDSCNLKQLRDNGSIKKILDDILFKD